MKFLFSLVIFISGSCYLQAQKLSVNKRTAISALNEKAKEAIGNIRLWKSGKKVIIEEASITPSEMGVKITLVVANSGSPNTTFTSEFDPSYITEISDLDLAEESPVGQMSIMLHNEISFNTVFYKKDIDKSYRNEIIFSYLKVEKKNFKEIQSAFYKLKEIYINEDNEPLRPLANTMNKTNDFWISSEGTSNTCRLVSVFVTGCKIHFEYSIKTISTNGKKEGIYLTIVPLSDIDDVLLDRNKSKPNCIMLQAGKKGFETYKYEEEKYVPTAAVGQVPLFIDVSYDWRRDEIMEILKTQVKECGGGKIKL
jgi:hypothetical protein